MKRIYAYLLLLIIELLPLGSKELPNLTEAGVGVLGLDSLSPVLGEEHVCGECSLGRVLVLFAFCGTRSLLSLLGSLALIRKLA